MPDQTQQFSFKVLTINIHKGFTAFNRRFILPELRDAVHTVSADIVCLQEVMGAHEVHRCMWKTGPIPRTTSFSPTLCGAILPTVAMPYTRKGITATPYCRVIPLNDMRIAMFRSMVRKSAACSTALPPMTGKAIHVMCVHLGLREAHR